MADSTIIKEFLVALGYKTDETAAKKFKDGVASATKSVVVLGTAIEATALAVATGVARFAANLEQLYFAAQRTNSSADSLKAFDLAARNFGASIDEAQGSVEGLAAFLRNQPGGGNIVAGWLGSVGISARDANGQLLTGTSLIAQIGKMFRHLRENNQWFRANQIAGQLGISDKTALAMSQEGFEDELARQEKRAQGWQKVSEAAHRFMIQLEDLKLQFYQMMLGFEGPAMKALEGAMKKLSKLMKDHGKEIVTDLSIAFTWVVDGLGHLIDWLDRHGKEILVRIEAVFLDFNFFFEMYVKPTLSWLYEKFVDLDGVTGGWSTKLLAVLATLKLLGATGIVTGILGIGGALIKALSGAALGLGAEGAAAGWAAAAGTAFGVAAVTALGVGLGAILYYMFPKFFGNAGEKVADAIDYANNAYKSAKSADPKDWYATHYPWQHPPANAQAQVSINTNVTVHESTDPHKTAKTVAGEVNQVVRTALVERAIVREFAAVVR